MITIEEFDKIVEEFLPTRGDCDIEYYCTEAELAKGILSDLRNHIFSDQLDKDARRAKYEELKKEFESCEF